MKLVKSKGEKKKKVDDEEKRKAKRRDHPLDSVLGKDRHDEAVGDGET